MLKSETEAFTRMPFADVAQKYWILDEKTFICTVDPDGTTSIVRMEQILGQTDLVPQESVTVEKSHFTTFIQGNKATVYHHQLVKLPLEGIELRSHEVRNLEKIDGTWKIHNSTGVKVAL